MLENRDRPDLGTQTQFEGSIVIRGFAYARIRNLDGRLQAYKNELCRIIEANSNDHRPECGAELWHRGFLHLFLCLVEVKRLRFHTSHSRLGFFWIRCLIQTLGLESNCGTTLQTSSPRLSIVPRHRRGQPRPRTEIWCWSTAPMFFLFCFFRPPFFASVEASP